jgi:Acyl-CoA dehydrogenase, C-terminal domain
VELALTSDQVMILDAIDSLAKHFSSPSLGEVGFALTHDVLETELSEGGYLDVALDPNLGELTAALVVERLARLPYALEAGASALVRPALGGRIGGDVCLLEEGRAGRLLRFLKVSATVVLVGKNSVRSFSPSKDQIRAEPEALYGYPMGTLLVDPVTAATTTHDVSPQDVRTRWRIALAAEAAGLLAAALESVTTHTSDRNQFGRPLATFQALRHRLAEAQVRTNGVYWLAMKAAATLDAGDAALAALYAQETARAVVYDFHQFLGAMGMTLEHPLHLWTYRLKALASELGGRGANALAAADAIWG